MQVKLHIQTVKGITSYQIQQYLFTCDKNTLGAVQNMQDNSYVFASYNHFSLDPNFFNTDVN